MHGTAMKIKVNPFTPKAVQPEQNTGHEIGKGRRHYILQKKDFSNKNETMLSYCIYF
jgi:hypothetical protein